MRGVTLSRLSLRYWKGVIEADFVFPRHAVVSGDNGAGKSTLLNAYLWLLTGVDDNGRTNYRLFNELFADRHENAVPASVTGVFLVDGHEHSFKRTAVQGWSRPRGQSEYVRSGADKYGYFHDDIEVSAAGYWSAVESVFAPVEHLKFMLNLRHFLLLDWRELRQSLAVFMGELSMSDFAGDYKEIEEDLRSHTPDELRASCKSRIRPLKSAIDSLPDTIAALKDSLPDLSGASSAREAIADARRQIAGIDAGLADSALAMQPFLDKRRDDEQAIRDMQARYDEAALAYERDYRGRQAALQDKIDDARRGAERAAQRASAREAERARLQRRLSDALSRHDVLSMRRKELLGALREAKGLLFSETECPYCGQPLPASLAEKKQREFYEKRNAKCASIVDEGKKVRDEMTRAEEEADALRDELSRLDNAAAETPPDVSDLEDDLRLLQASHIPYAATGAGRQLADAIEEAARRLPELPQNANDALLAMKQSLLDDIEAHSKALGAENEHARIMSKIAAAESQLADNAAELARLEGKLLKIKEYENERARLLSDNISKHFHFVTVRMTEKDKSGNVVPCCAILDGQGVNAAGTNNAARILCGLDIAQAFCRLDGIAMPLFIDNCESINGGNLPAVDNQTVKLFFKPDASLSVEDEDNGSPRNG